MLLQQVPDHNRIVFYDGDCVLCSKTVIFLLKADKKKRLRFAPLSGSISKSLSIAKADKQESSVVFYNNGNLYYKSTAVLKIAEQLPFPWLLFSIFFLIPTFIRDYIYRVIARNRYKWFGKNTSCFLKHPNYGDRFLD
jgi:predicted DCC family thiol-disulfide oxidoreductase YuxK